MSQRQPTTQPMESLFLLREELRRDVQALRPPLERGTEVWLLVFAHVAAVLMIAGCYRVLVETITWFQLRNSGIACLADVTKVDDTDPEGASNVVYFVYAHATGRLHEGESGISGKPATATVPIRYLPHHPHVAWLEEDLGILSLIGWLVGILILWPMTAILLFAGLPVLWRNTIRRWNGLLLFGTAKGCDTMVDDEGDYISTIYYEFLAPAKKLLDGVGYTTKEPPQPGAVIAVLYHTDDDFRML
ncbi:MAG TPA: hypothetical protein VEJ63_22920 [Planctomycetota bacterium]|nr:hypothetical protein [Planctomycetota bacterium]